MKTLSKLLDYIMILIFLIPWIAGVVIAQGMWATIFATCIPFWAWYLVIEKIMQMNGII